jgi:hypothetical protein
VAVAERILRGRAATMDFMMKSKAKRLFGNNVGKTGKVFRYGFSHTKYLPVISAFSR